MSLSNMNRFCFLLIFLCYSVVNGDSECRPLNYQQKQGFLLILRWPPSFCLDGPVDECAGSLDWVIYGFWPMVMFNRTAAPLQFCCTDQRFSKSRISSIVNDLLRYWPPESYTADVSYWSSQWKRYGSCCHDPTFSPTNRIKFQPIDVAEYFALALDLRRRFFIEKWLKEGGIKPSNEKAYPIKLIRNTIANHLGQMGDHGQTVFQLKCYHNHPATGNSNRSVWNEIRFCFDDQLDLQDCSKFIHYSADDDAGQCEGDQMFWIIK